MRPFWQPQSAVLLADPRAFASPVILRRLLVRGRPVSIVYAGDRMWPSIRHGRLLDALPLGPEPPATGEVVVATPGGIPDLLRVAGLTGESVRLVADADPEEEWVAGRGDLVARVEAPPARVARWRRRARRRLLDLREAWRGAPDPATETASTILDKYEMQAPFYARAAGVEIDPRLAERVEERFRPGARLLVVGSGSGRECFGLARAGYDVLGIDFSPTMVRLARESGARLGLDVEFVVGDVRRQALPRASFAGVLFTYDFYGLIPGRQARVDLLRRLRAALEPGGAVFLSARRTRRPRDRAILTLQWIAARRRGPAEWGMSHTRWVGADGGLHRAFMHVFTPRRLAAEIREAGFAAGAPEGGHLRLEPQAPRP